MSVHLGDQSVWQSQNMEHLRYEYDLKPTDLVLDIGSYRMEWANEILKRYGCRVICFDALDNNAAWIFEGELEMGGQYYYTSMYDKGELGAVRKVKCVDIAKYLKDDVELMKVNIEGGEYTLLDYIIRKGLIWNIKHLQVQFHYVDGLDCEALYADIAKRLSVTHSIQWRYPFCWESWKRG